MSRGCHLDVWGGVGPGGCTGWPGWLCERARVAGSPGACALSPRPGTLRAAQRVRLSEMNGTGSKEGPCTRNFINVCSVVIFTAALLFPRSVVSDSLRPQGLQHARLPCPSPTPRVYSD